jgi:hypothetical protein
LSKPIGFCLVAKAATKPRVPLAVEGSHADGVARLRWDRPPDVRDELEGVVLRLGTASQMRNDERTVLCEALRNMHLDRLLFFLSVFLFNLRSERQGVVGVRQPGLEITDDRAEKARREQPRPEGTGRILTYRRQLSQGGSGRRGHPAKLPADLLADRPRPVRGGQSSRLGGIPGGTQGVPAHMRDACRLPGRSGGGHRCGTAHLTSGGMSDETAAGLSDAKLATSKRPQPGDGITGTAIPRRFRLEQSQHPLRAVRRPPRDDPPVSFAQRLRRTHPPDSPTRFGAPALHAADRQPDAVERPRAAARAKSRPVANGEALGELITDAAAEAGTYGK